MAVVAERQSAYGAAFETFAAGAAAGPDWLRRSREAAMQRFLDAGFPTSRDEEWKFTNISPIAEVTFDRAAEAMPDRRALEPFLVPGDGPLVVLVNGRVSSALSSVGALSAGVTVRTLAGVVEAAAGTAGAGGAASIREALATSSPTGSPAPFADLHQAFFDDALAIEIAAGAVVAAPIRVLALAVPGARPEMTLPRLVVMLGERAEASLVEMYGSAGTTPSLTNAVTGVVLGPGAVLRHVRLQRESAAAFHVARLDARLARASVFHSTAITLGGRIARTDITATLAGEGAECTLNGLYVADGETLTDTHTTIDHALPHCPSHEVYKGILGGRARAVFNGKIIVRQDAQKTNAKQTNKALLLSDDASINTKPQLEIFADDVRCTHGAAIGQLDEDAMFYLQARGIAEVDARNILIHAFAGEVLDGVAVAAVRERAMEWIEEKLSLPHA